VRLHPLGSDEPQYAIRNADQSSDRIVFEHELCEDLGGACRNLWRRPQDGPWRPQFHALLTSEGPKQTASSRLCSHTVHAPAQPKPLRSHSMASKP
jgi:hypothetical protein